MSTLPKSLFYWPAVPQEEEPAVPPAVRRPRRLHCRTHGRDVEVRPELERDLRFLGSADPARPVHHGQNHLLEVSENQRPHIQHHVGREGRKEGRKEGERASG